MGQFSESECEFALQVVLAFFEKRKTQRWSLIGGKQEERLYWEQWYMPSALTLPFTWMRKAPSTCEAPNNSTSVCVFSACARP